MSYLCIIIASLGVVAAGGCSRTNYGSSMVNVLVVNSQAGHAVVPLIVFSQLSAGRRSVIGQTRHRVFSINGGLPDVRLASQNPIVAATDQDG